MKANIKGITHPCPYCEMDGSNPTPEQSALHKLHHNPMSNTTQNDETKQMEKAVYEGFAKSEKILKDTSISWKGHQSYAKEVKMQSAQNDRAKQVAQAYLLIRDAFWDEYLDHKTCEHDIGCVVTSDPLEKKVSLIMSKLLADARKEVIERIEAMPDKDVRPQITVWLESKEFCLGYNKALSDVLATLREEEGK